MSNRNLAQNRGHITSITMLKQVFIHADMEPCSAGCVYHVQMLLNIFRILFWLHKTVLLIIISVLTHVNNGSSGIYVVLLTLDYVHNLILDDLCALV